MTMKSDSRIRSAYIHKDWIIEDEIANQHDLIVRLREDLDWLIIRVESLEGVNHEDE